MVIRRRPRELGLRRAGGSVGSTSGHTSSCGVRGRTGCAQEALGFSRAPSAPWGANGGAVAAQGHARTEVDLAFKGSVPWGKGNPGSPQRWVTVWCRGGASGDNQWRLVGGVVSQWPKAARPPDACKCGAWRRPGPTCTSHRSPLAPRTDQQSPACLDVHVWRRMAVKPTGPGATSRAPPRSRAFWRQTFQGSTVQEGFSQNSSTEVDQTTYRKVVDLKTPYNFYKGHLGF
jgi:hypothetical protein